MNFLWSLCFFLTSAAAISAQSSQPNSTSQDTSNTSGYENAYNFRNLMKMLTKLKSLSRKDQVSMGVFVAKNLGTLKGTSEDKGIAASNMMKGFLALDNIIADGKKKVLYSGQQVDFGSNVQLLLSGQPQSTKSCFNDIKTVVEAAWMKKSWALEMIDAIGTPGPGLLRQNLRFLGDFDECMDAGTGQDFEGLYCTTYTWILKFQDVVLPTPVGAMVGVCVPDSCKGSDVETLLGAYLQSQPAVIAGVIGTSCKERHKSLTTKAKFVITVCSIFVMLIVAGTFYDVVYKRWWTIISGGEDNASTSQDSGDTLSSLKNIKSEREPIIDAEFQKTMLYTENNAAPQITSHKAEFCDQLLMSFSAYTNTERLLDTKEPPGSIGCIHGIRFLSNTWIILFHLASVFGPPIADNQVPYLEKAYDRWTFMAVANAVITVDTFFAIGGLLNCFVVLKKLCKEAATPKFFANFYLHRFWRLTPPYMLVLMTHAVLSKHVSDGPLWPKDGLETNECKDTWWTNLLYINNIVKDNDECMNWTWYLSADMQFYIVSPLVFLPLFYYGWRGLVVPFGFILVAAISSGVITDAYDLPGVQRLERWLPMDIDEYHSSYYVKPYTRIGPYVIGIVTGYLLYVCQCKAKLSRVVVVVGWVAATATALACLYGLSGHVTDQPLDTVVNAWYNALHRIGWGVAVCWLVFACVNGYGGFVNRLLSWKAFIPLSRLTYCAYLVHLTLIQTYVLSQRRPFYLDTLNLTTLFVAMVTLSYGVAFVVYLVFEVPMAGLEKVFKGQLKRFSKNN